MAEALVAAEPALAGRTFVIQINKTQTLGVYMKFNRILLSLVLSLSAGFANASDDAALLYALMSKS